MNATPDIVDKALDQKNQGQKLTNDQRKCLRLYRQNALAGCGGRLNALSDQVLARLGRISNVIGLKPATQINAHNNEVLARMCLAVGMQNDYTK